MNLKVTLHVVGGLLLVLGFSLIFPLLVSLGYGDGAHWAFVKSAGFTFLLGAGLYGFFRTEPVLGTREGFATVSLGWIAFGVAGGLPYLFSGALPWDVHGMVSAFFESVSGFTTTGSTIFRDLVPIPQSVLLWRSLTQWLGGMGMIVLSLAILPFLGVGGAQLFQAEVPGVTKDRLTPRIQDTAKALWKVYFYMTFVLVVLLVIEGMTPFESICHAFTTMATGGFSTRNESVAAFASPWIHWTLILFMFLAGVNFNLYHLFRKQRFRAFWESEEFVFYLSILLGAVLVITVANVPLYGDHWHDNVRDSAFQVVTITTTTGYATADYEKWAPLAQYLLVFLMWMGACAGSTAGGLKVARLFLILKHGVLQVSRLIHPKGVSPLRLDNRPVPAEVLKSVLGFFAIYVGVFVLASIGMAGLGLDFISSGASVIACLSNVGPGLGSVGPTDNFAHVPTLGKVILSFCMLIGRLELFTMLVLFVPSFWRR